MLCASSLRIILHRWLFGICRALAWVQTAFVKFYKRRFGMRRFFSCLCHQSLRFNIFCWYPMLRRHLISHWIQWTCAYVVWGKGLSRLLPLVFYSRRRSVKYRFLARWTQNVCSWYNGSRFDAFLRKQSYNFNTLQFADLWSCSVRRRIHRCCSSHLVDTVFLHTFSPKIAIPLFWQRF